MLSPAPLHAGDINLNGNMELGVLNGPVPGFKLERVYISRAQAENEPERSFFPVTVEGGNPGRCLQLGGDYGYQISLEDFYIRQDCEVEISFDAKAVPDKDGNYLPFKKYKIDFRNIPIGKGRKMTGRMLSGFPFRPEKDWKHFSQRFQIKAWENHYAIWVLSPDQPHNGLLLDNFRFRRVDVADTPGNDYAVTFDQAESAYAFGDAVTATIRAQLTAKKPELSGKAVLAFHHNQEKITAYPVKLRRGKDGIYEGKVTFKAETFGSLALSLELPGLFGLRRIGGDFAVLLPRVIHPRLSPGWSLGTNVDGGHRIYHELDPNANRCLTYSNSFDRQFRIYAQAGLGVGRIWNEWRVAEPEPGVFTGSPAISLALDKLEKHGIDPVFCLMGSMNVGKGIKGKDRRFPLHLQKYYRPTPDKKRPEGCLMLPLDTVWLPYLRRTVELRKNQVKIWELGNEPGLFRVPPEGYVKWYTEFCRRSAREIKAIQPDAIVLGNGVTGDFGMNVVGWCKQLNEADPDYCKEIDGIAFHPYNCGMDYMDGKTFRLRDTVRNISATLKHPRPLWNTEDYYLHTVYYKQIKSGIHWQRFGANEIARAELDSLLDGVVAHMGPQRTVWFQQTNVNGICPPAEIVSATNALSFLLKDMVKVEELDCGEMVRAAFFTDRSGKVALGAFYDMRPEGSTWQFRADPAVRVMDIYGNKIKEPVHLRYEPCYLRGDAAAVRKLMLNSKFTARKSAQSK